MPRSSRSSLPGTHGVRSRLLHLLQRRPHRADLPVRRFDEETAAPRGCAVDRRRTVASRLQAARLCGKQNLPFRRHRPAPDTLFGGERSRWSGSTCPITSGSDDVYKVLILDDADRLDLLKTTLLPAFAERFAVFKSWDRLLEFVHRDGSKGAALENLYRTLRIPREDVIAIGDEENDISMILAAGIGVAMGNAKPAVKAAAHYQTLSNRFDGVSAAIDKYVFDKESGMHGF
ncbi:MAG: HAD hydrolase family protein [Bacillus subtilis]|nr:HAD hydrolase family protein [Bacillus subtilis]